MFKKKKYQVRLFIITLLFINFFTIENAFSARKALVIGNSEYPFGNLKNPVNDANDMAKVLEDVGFKVTKLLNGEKKEMESIVGYFTKNISQEDVALFYYAGHALQANDENYLLSSDIKEDELKIENYSIKLTSLTQKMKKSAMSIIILDACRTNPYRSYYIDSNNTLTRSKRSIAVQPKQGLAPPKRAKGTFIAFSTDVGNVAYDGDGNEKNGLFTKHLLKNIKKPGFRLEDVFKKVREGVALESNDKQIPWDSSSITGVFYFVKPQDKIIRQSDERLFTPVF